MQRAVPSLSRLGQVGIAPIICGTPSLHLQPLVPLDPCARVT